SRELLVQLLKEAIRQAQYGLDLIKEDLGGLYQGAADDVLSRALVERKNLIVTPRKDVRDHVSGPVQRGRILSPSGRKSSSSLPKSRDEALYARNSQGSHRQELARSRRVVADKAGHLRANGASQTR